MELFGEYMAKKPVPAQPTTPQATPAQPTNGSFIVVVEGKEYTLTDQDIDCLEKKFGAWENDDGVNFWWLLRRLKNDGAKKINLI